MLTLIAAALLAAPAAADTHHEQFDHGGARVHVTYHGQLTPELRQVGAASAPGGPATLRCRWQARVIVERSARADAGHVATRRIDAPVLVTGHRPGWCDTQAAAIGAEVAAASDRLRAHLVEVARRDRGVLVAELEQARGRNS
jgi:hypothetical protein